MKYFASKISDNISETSEGFLICKDVPIARTGKYQYTENDIIGNNSHTIVDVYRDEEEVFDEKAMASFEGKPLTNEHPQEFVNSENFSYLVKGHCQNVHEGKGQFKGMLMADLIVEDKDTIELVKNGKREISCGYDCDFQEIDGKIYQKNIRGNHIAIVENGRAGSKIAIRDTKTNNKENIKMGKDVLKAFLTLFGHSIKDSNAEEINEIVDVATDTLAADTKKKDTEEQKKEEMTEEQKQIKELKEKVDKLTDALEEFTKKEKVEEETEETTDGCGKKKDEKEEVIDSNEELDAKQLVNDFNPLVAKITDSQLKEEFITKFNKLLDRGENPIIKIEQQIADNNIKTISDSEIQNYYNERNPHLRKESK